MKNSLSLVFFLIILEPTFANSIFPSVTISQFSLIIQPQIKVVLKNTVQKKATLKERLLLKWYKKKSHQVITEETKKKNVKLLGFLSLATGAAAILLLVFAGLIYSDVVLGIFAFLMLCFIPTALILGILSLTKRKKLADKKGTSAIPAIIGIILGSALLISFIIALISISINGLF